MQNGVSYFDEINSNHFHSSHKSAYTERFGSALTGKIMSGGKFNIGGIKNFCKINKSYLSITKGFLRVPLIVNLK